MTNYHMACSEALDTHNLAKSKSQCDVIRRQRPMRAHLFVYIIEQVASHTCPEPGSSRQGVGTVHVSSNIAASL